MDDRQLYKDTFDQVRSSIVISEEMFTMKPKRNTLRTVAILAAVLCLLLACGITAWATNLFGLRDLVIAQDVKIGPPGNPQSKDAETDDPRPVDIISLQGYYDSPEAQAAQEWWEFYNSYVPTLELDNSIFAPGTAYNNYGVYDQTMADKLDEITEKYGLTLYDNMTDILTEQALNDAMGGEFLSGADSFYHNVLMGVLRGEGEFLSGACSFSWGYLYDDGTMQFDGDCSMDAGTLDFQFRRSQKGSFSDVTLNVGHAKDYDQWQYETFSGVTVMLALGPTKSLIFVDLPECFVCVNVLAGTDGGLFYDDLRITKADLELLADCFNWTLCADAPQAPEGSSMLPPEYDEEDVQPPSDDFYSAATKFPAYEVERFASTVCSDILVDKNWKDLSGRIAYPITIGGTTYQDADAFLAQDWDSLFSEDFLSALENETCTRMFCTSDGIMMANGVIWIAEVYVEDSYGSDSMLKIVTIYA